MVVLSFMMTSEFFGLDFGLLVRLAIRKYILIIFWSKKYRNETIAGEKIIVSVSGYCHSGHSSHRLDKHFGPLLCNKAVSYPSDMQRID